MTLSTAQVHTDSPWCCHGEHYQPADGPEAIAWAAVRDEQERPLTAGEQLVHDVLDQVEIACEAAYRDDCPEDFSSAAPARAVVAALVDLIGDAAVRTAAWHEVAQWVRDSCNGRNGFVCSACINQAKKIDAAADTPQAEPTVLDWASLREAARAAGYFQWKSRKGDNRRIWARPYPAEDGPRFDGHIRITRDTIGADEQPVWRIYLAGPGGNADLVDRTPSDVLEIACRLGLGATSETTEGNTQ